MDEMEEIIKKAQDGDAEAIEYILNKSRKDIHFWAKKYEYIRGLDYEDIFQEGLIAVWEALKKYKGSGGCSFRSFASICFRYNMCTLIIKNNAQKRKIANHTTYVNDIGRFGNFVNIEKRVIEKEKIQNIFSVLSDLERNILMSLYAGFKPKEVSGKMNISIGKIEYVMDRIRYKVKKMQKCEENKTENIEGKLSDLEYSIYVLYTRGFSLEEIADKIQESEDTVYYALIRAERKARKLQ